MVEYDINLQAGGANTQVQYNNGGILAGDSNLTWDNTNKILTSKSLKTTNGAGAALTNVSVAFPAPFTYTNNSGYDEMVFIVGTATTLQVSINGTSLTSVPTYNYNCLLAPSDYITLSSYTTAAPLMYKKPL